MDNLTKKFSNVLKSYSSYESPAEENRQPTHLKFTSSAAASHRRPEEDDLEYPSLQLDRTTQPSSSQNVHNPGGATFFGTSPPKNKRNLPRTSLPTETYPERQIKWNSDINSDPDRRTRTDKPKTSLTDSTKPISVPLKRFYRTNGPLEGTELAEEEIERKGIALGNVSLENCDESSPSDFEFIPSPKPHLFITLPSQEDDETGKEAIAAEFGPSRHNSLKDFPSSSGYFSGHQKNKKQRRQSSPKSPRSRSPSPQLKSFLRRHFPSYHYSGEKHHSLRVGGAGSDRMRSRSHSDSDKYAEELRENKSVGDETGKAVKGKIQAAWNNVKYGWNWKHRSSFDDESPIWLLGNFYHSRPVSPDHQETFERDLGKIDLDQDHNDFTMDFRSRVWFTYRTGFEKLEGTDVENDCGWGCMLRSGQMMIAQALVLHLLGRDWNALNPQSYDTIMAHRNIIRYFGDSYSCPLSIHSLVKIGNSRHDKSVGDWYGPGSTALVLRDLLNRDQVDPILDQLAVYVARDCAISLEEIDKLCSESSNSDDCFKSPNFDTFLPNCTTSPNYNIPSSSLEPKPIGTTGGHSPNIRDFYKIDVERYEGAEAGRSRDNSPSSSNGLPPPGRDRVDSVDLDTGSSNTSNFEGAEVGWQKSLILIVPLRLGTDKLNPVYKPHLRTILALKNCIGIMGGKKKHSMYFVGWHGEHLVYLDPHFAQEFEDVNTPNFSVKSFHCRWPRKMEFADIDPSCAVGFYCRDREEFYRLLVDLSQVVDSGQSTSASRHPLFSILQSFDVLQHAEGFMERRFSRSNPAEVQKRKATALSHGFELL